MNHFYLAIPLAASVAACATADLAADQDSWRDAITQAPIETDGCFHAAYPDMTWEQVSCTAAPNRPFAQRLAAAVPFTVGNGADYALQDTGTIQKAAGTFLHVKNVTSENDGGQSDTYSIQLNSNFMSGTAACNGISGCQSWSQFVYSTSETSAFMQDWLIGFGDTCPATPAGWNSDGQGDCFINSAAVDVQQIAAADLGTLKMTGGAKAGGNDTLAFAVGSEAFTTHQKDTITNLASKWNAAGVQRHRRRAAAARRRSTPARR